MQKSYYIIYDTETGGLDKTKNPDRILITDWGFNMTQV